MYSGKRILAVIPARGGSVSVPRKNIRPLAGRPLLAWTIRQAEMVDALDLTVVSTDDAEIKSIALDYGARVIDRPAELASATARTEPALIHALDMLAEDGEEAFDFVAVLEPTSPFRSPGTIAGAIAHIVDEGKDSLLAVRETKDNVGRLESGVFRPLAPDAPRRRQDREPLYVESSTIYVCNVDFLRRTGSVVAEDWLAYVVSGQEALDINTAEDFLRAQWVMEQREGAP